jgi:hypothetical protein
VSRRAGVTRLWGLSLRWSDRNDRFRTLAASASTAETAGRSDQTTHCAGFVKHIWPGGSSQAADAFRHDGNWENWMDRLMKPMRPGRKVWVATQGRRTPPTWTASGFFRTAGAAGAESGAPDSPSFSREGRRRRSIASPTERSAAPCPAGRRRQNLPKAAPAFFTPPHSFLNLGAALRRDRRSRTGKAADGVHQDGSARALALLGIRAEGLASIDSANRAA